MSAFKTIGIIGKEGDDSVVPVLNQLAQYLAAQDCTVQLGRSAADCLDDDYGQVVDRETLAQNCDLIIVVGGDGTLLQAARVAAPQNVPLLGINMGRLGFMVDVLPENMVSTLDQVLAGEFIRDQRTLLCAHVIKKGVKSGPHYALNDVVIRSKDTARVIEFDTRMDGVFISRHRADGMIVATPTGSTAYALSGGGPVLHPALESIALVPICPHTLSDRPLVIDASRHIEIDICATNRHALLLTTDGQANHELVTGDKVSIRSAEHKLQLIHPPGYDYFSVLRRKLSWGRESTGSVSS